MRNFLILLFLFSQYSLATNFECVVSVSDNTGPNTIWSDIFMDKTDNTIIVYKDYNPKVQHNKSIVFNLVDYATETQIKFSQDQGEKITLQALSSRPEYKKTLLAFPRKTTNSNEYMIGGASFKEKYTLGVTDEYKCTETDIILVLLIIERKLFGNMDN